MRSNSRPAVGSPTFRVVAIMVATLLLALALAAAGAGAARLLAAGPLVVAADGSGDYLTIQAAVDEAADGDLILVRPGNYGEQVLIEGKDITVRGDGPVEDIVVELAGGKLFTVSDSDAEISNLTLRGDLDTQGVTLTGGAPVIRGVVFDQTGVPYQSGQVGSGSSLDIRGGGAHVLESHFSGGGEIMIGDLANAVFERNELVDGPHLYLQAPGDDAVVRDNNISGTFDRAIGLFGPSTMEISGNTIEDAGGSGITVGWNSADGHDPLIKDNDISNTLIAIMVYRNGAPIVEANTLHDNDTAILSQDADATYADNHLTGNGTGISLEGRATLDGNSIEGGRAGLVLYGADAAPVLSGNTICGNLTNVVVSGTSNTPALQYDDSNEICPDEPAG